MIKNAKNFAKGTVSAGYDASATAITLSSGHGARFPAVPFQATWWNSTDYPDPSDDPNVEVVTVTALDVFSAPLLDDFNRANEGPPMTGWTRVNDLWGSSIQGFNIVSNAATNQTNSSANFDVFTSSSTFNSDQEVYAQMSVADTSGSGVGTCGLLLRINDPTGTPTGYRVDFATNGPTIRAYKISGDSTQTQLGSDITLPFRISSNDWIGARMISGTLTAWVKHGGLWMQVATFTDGSPYSGSYVGILADDATASTYAFNSFYGGNTNVDRITVVRGQGDTTASTKNTAGKTYKLAATLTADVINQEVMPSQLWTPGYGVYCEHDDFISTGEAGQVKLTWHNLGEGVSHAQFIVGEPDHPGIGQLLTDAASNAYVMYWLANYSAGMPTQPRLDNATNWEFRFIFRLNQVTNVRCVVGLNDNSFGSGNVFGLILDTSLNANWRYGVHAAASEYYDTQTYSPTAGDWIHLRLRSLVANVWRISHSVNGGAFNAERTFGPSGCDVTVTLPTVGLDPLFYVSSYNASAKTLDCDLFAARWNLLNR